MAQPSGDKDKNLQNSFEQENQEAQRVAFIKHLDTHYWKGASETSNQQHARPSCKTQTTSTVLENKPTGKTKREAR